MYVRPPPPRQGPYNALVGFSLSYTTAMPLIATHYTRRVLVVVSTTIFLLCTVHVGASLQQLLEAFVYAPTNVPDYATMYWGDCSTPLHVLKDILRISQEVSILCMQSSEVILKGTIKILAQQFILVSSI